MYDEPQLTLWTRPWTVKFRFWRVEGRDEGPSKPVRRELSSSDPWGPTLAKSGPSSSDPYPPVVPPSTCTLYTIQYAAVSACEADVLWYEGIYVTTHEGQPAGIESPPAGGPPTTTNPLAAVQQQSISNPAEIQKQPISNPAAVQQ